MIFHYGPTGFTQTPEIVEIMSKYEPQTYYSYPNKGAGGIIHFDGITGEDLQKLGELLPEKILKDAQNDSPTFGEFIKMSKKYPSMTFHGYRVLPERSDERITIEGFYIPKIYTDNTIIVEFTQLRPDEMDWVEENGVEVLRCWWD